MYARMGAIKGMTRRGLLLVVAGLLAMPHVLLLAQDEGAGTFDPVALDGIDLREYPVLPDVTEAAREVHAAGLETQNPHVFSKVGDCMTASPLFLTPFAAAPADATDYDLGDDAELQRVVDYFAGTPARAEGFAADSFANPGLATTSGFNTASVLDPIWANPNWCLPNESPLACEYRVSRPAFALVMFGTNDVMFLEAAQFDANLRSIVQQTLDAGIVPLLHTFPTRPEFEDESLLFNRVIVAVAQDFDVPLVNLWLALEALPNQGVDLDETIHLTAPEDGRTGLFDAEHLAYGYTLRNRVALQALDVLLAELALYEEAVTGRGGAHIPPQGCFACLRVSVEKQATAP